MSLSAFTRLLLFFAAFVFVAPAEETEEPAPQQADAELFERSKEASLKDKIVIIHIGQKDLVNKQAFRFWQRTLDRAVADKAKAVVLELDTPGGLAFDTRDIITDDLVKLPIPLFAFVKREALSAGALIAFTTDRIYMAPGTTIGSAGLVSSAGEIEKVMRAKLESAFEATMRGVAERKGHRMDVMRAMMFVDDENERTFGSVTVRKGGLLNLTAKEAAEIVDDKPLLAAGVVDSIDELLKIEKLDGIEIVRPKPTGFEGFAWWIAAFSPLLIAVGIVTAWFEIKAPGFGIFGFISLTAFSLFFFGNNVAGNLAGYELTALFLIGVALIILEIFVLPGGIAGIIGGLMIIGSLWFAMADEVEFDRIEEADSIMPALESLLIIPGLKLLAGIGGAIAIGAIAARFLPKIPLLRSLIAEENLSAGDPSVELSDTSHVGELALALTDLRPTGTIILHGVKKDAISRHGLIPKDSEVRILEEGMTYKVERAE